MTFLDFEDHTPSQSNQPGALLSGADAQQSNDTFIVWFFAEKSFDDTESDQNSVWEWWWILLKLDLSVISN